MRRGSRGMPGRAQGCCCGWDGLPSCLVSLDWECLLRLAAASCFALIVTTISQRRMRAYGERQGAAGIDARSAARQLLEQLRDDRRLDGVDQAAPHRPLVGPACREHSGAGRHRVVDRAAQVGNAVGYPEPARGAVALIRKADAARVDEAHGADRAVVLLVRVAGGHKRCVDAAKTSAYRSGVDALVTSEGRCGWRSERSFRAAERARSLDLCLVRTSRAATVGAMASTAGALETGWLAVEDGRFKEGRGHFEEAVTALPGAEAYDGLACALRGLGEVDATLAARAMAHRLYVAEGREAAAARVAALIAADLWVLRGDGAVARAWLDRAERLLEGHEDSCEAGWVGIRAREVLGYETVRDRAAGDRGIELGRRHGDRDLELMGRAVRGLCAVNLGDVEEGMRDLDEVALAGVAGELRAATERGRAWCLLIFACERVRDVERAAQWCDTVRRLAERTEHPQLFAFCRTHYAGVLTARGDYVGAEEELGRAALLFAAGAPGVAFEAELMLAELRRRQGMLEEAAQLSSAHGWHPTAQLILAELAWDRGEVPVAHAALDRRSRRTDTGAVADAAALYLAVRIAVAEGAAQDASDAAAALRAFADRAGTLPLRAAASAAEGVASPSARPLLEDAADLWAQAGMPYEAARAETALAALTGDETARERAARRLAELGCTVDINALDAPLTPAARAPDDGDLSRRELQVLRLVAEGLSDPEIAERLVLSPHTVHRHVANIRSKLRQPSRAAAAAKAVRDGII